MDIPQNLTATDRFIKIYEGMVKQYGFEKKDIEQITEEDLEETMEKSNMTDKDKYQLMVAFQKMKYERLKKGAIRGAIAQTMTRNLSHGLGKTILFGKEDIGIKKFTEFCDIDTNEINLNKGFQEIFLKDCEKLENHPLNQQYKELRKQYSPFEAIKMLPWSKILSGYDVEAPLATSNDEVMNGSKMGTTHYCTGRINTILGILALNEGIEYVNKHFKYAEVIKDGLSDIMDDVPQFQRDLSYLNESLNYEDPHQMLYYIDDEGQKHELDPNQIAVKQLAGPSVEFNNIAKIFDGDVGDVAYEMYFLNYINNELHKNINSENRDAIIKILEQYNEMVGGSEVIINRIISFAIRIGDKNLETKYMGKLKELAEEYPNIKNKFSYHINRDSQEELEDFIHQRYGKHFSINDVLNQYKL